MTRPTYTTHSSQIWPNNEAVAIVDTVDVRDHQSHWVKLCDRNDMGEFDQFLIAGATLPEVQAIVRAINAAIDGAKARAAEDADALKIAAQ